MNIDEKRLAEIEAEEEQESAKRIHAAHRLDLAGRFMTATLSRPDFMGMGWNDGVVREALEAADALLARWAATNPGGEE